MWCKMIFILKLFFAQCTYIKYTLVSIRFFLNLFFLFSLPSLHLLFNFFSFIFLSNNFDLNRLFNHLRLLFNICCFKHLCWPMLIWIIVNYLWFSFIFSFSFRKINRNTLTSDTKICIVSLSNNLLSITNRIKLYKSKVFIISSYSISYHSNIFNRRNSIKVL